MSQPTECPPSVYPYSWPQLDPCGCDVPAAVPTADPYETVRAIFPWLQGDEPEPEPVTVTVLLEPATPYVETLPNNDVGLCARDCQTLLREIDGMIERYLSCQMPGTWELLVERIDTLLIEAGGLWSESMQAAGFVPTRERHRFPPGTFPDLQGDASPADP